MTESKGQGAKAGSWRIETRLLIDENGVTPGHWISDGEHELVTTARPSDLMVAIAELLGVESFSTAAEGIPDEEEDQ